MSPRAIATIVSVQPIELKSGEDYSMFVADTNHGFSASCEAGKVFESYWFKIKESYTFGMLATDLLKRKLPDWDPVSYNCQSFAVDAILNMAYDQKRMRKILETLIHNGAELAPGSQFTGGIAKYTQGILQQTGWTDTPLEDVFKRYKPLLDKPIESVRLYYFRSSAADLVTTKQTRKADFEKRRQAMCKLTGKGDERGSGELIESTDEAFDLKSTL